MFTINEEKGRVAFAFSSQPRQIDRVIRECGHFLEQYEVENTNDFKLVLREMLNNAIEHGNQGDEDKGVACEVRHLRDTLFAISVEDQGQGFDHADLDLSIPEDPYQIRNRGLALINSFADKLEFNEAGNRITAYVDLRAETGFKVEGDRDHRIIIPTGDMTSATADQLRQLLASMAAKSTGRYTFDFSNVQDIDSVSLSVLIGFAKELSKGGGDWDVSIVEAGKELADLFHLTGMDRIYSISRQGE